MQSSASPVNVTGRAMELAEAAGEAAGVDDVSDELLGLCL